MWQAEKNNEVVPAPDGGETYAEWWEVFDDTDPPDSRLRFRCVDEDAAVWLREELNAERG